MNPGANHERPEPWAAPILTIGYGNTRNAAGLCEVLQRHGVRTLIDVRSVPFSRRRREFSRESLEATLRAAGLAYRWMGDTLGGKPDDPACRTDGEIDYGKISTRPWFQRGVGELEGARRAGERPAIMCAELAPERCHRAWLVAEALIARGVPVEHIDADDSLVSHEAVKHRATRGQRALFVDPGGTSLPGGVEKPQAD